MCALLLHFGAGPEKLSSVPKSTGYRMMSNIDYAKWLQEKDAKAKAGKSGKKDRGTKSLTKNEEENLVVKVLEDEAARKEATDAVIAKLEVLFKEQDIKDRENFRNFLFFMFVLIVAGLLFTYAPGEAPAQLRQRVLDALRVDKNNSREAPDL